MGPRLKDLRDKILVNATNLCASSEWLSNNSDVLAATRSFKFMSSRSLRVTTIGSSQTTAVTQNIIDTVKHQHNLMHNSVAKVYASIRGTQLYNTSASYIYPEKYFYGEHENIHTHSKANKISRCVSYGVLNKTLNPCAETWLQGGARMEPFRVRVLAWVFSQGTRFL